MYVCYYVIGIMICCHCRSQGLQDSTKISVPTFEGPENALMAFSVWFLSRPCVCCSAWGFLLCWGRVPKIKGLFDGWLQDDSSLTPLNMANKHATYSRKHPKNMEEMMGNNDSPSPNWFFASHIFPIFRPRNGADSSIFHPECCFNVVTHHFISSTSLVNKKWVIFRIWC